MRLKDRKGRQRAVAQKIQAGVEASIKSLECNEVLEKIK